MSVLIESPYATFYYFRHFACLSIPFGSFGATYDVYLGLIGKRVVELPIRVRLYSLGVTAEALRANIDCKPEFLKGVCQFRPNFHVLKDVPCEPFCTDGL